MDALIRLIPLALIFIVVDMPWLAWVAPWAQSMFKRIQGGAPVEFRWAAAPPVYLALAFLVQRARSTLEAFLIGAATYAVYDFTNLATFQKYELGFAVADSLWGGILFALVREIGTRLGLL